MQHRSQKAFTWIISILQKANISFQISGGLAARAYGSKRPLYDIDIEIPDEDFETLLPQVQEKVISGPSRYQDDWFDLLLMTLNYEDQLIDIGGCSSDRIHNKLTGEWEDCPRTIQDAVMKEIFGILVPVMAKKHLIDYKSKIRRDTDLEDVEFIHHLVE